MISPYNVRFKGMFNLYLKPSKWPEILISLNDENLEIIKIEQSPRTSTKSDIPQEQVQCRVHYPRTSTESDTLPKKNV